MADAKFNVEVGYSSNKQEFDKINKEIDELWRKMTRDMQKTTDPKLKKELQSQLNIIEKMGIAYGKAFDNKTGQINVSKLNTEMQKSNITIKDFKNATQAAQQQGAACFNDIAASVLNANIQLKQSNKLLDQMAITFKNTVRYGISSSIFNNFTNSIQKAYDFTKNLDTSLNEIRIVSGKSSEEMAQLAINANKAAAALGKTTLDYTKAATIYYQQGLSNEEVAKRTETTLKAANVTGQSAQEVSEQLTAVWNGYQVTGEKVEEYVDKLAAVAATTAADLEELSTGMSKVASAAHVMGVDIDQLNAQMATIVSVTKQAPESVGTALRTIYARIADIKAGLDDEVSLGNYSGKMKKLGIDVLDASGKLRDMGDVIEEIGGKWNDLSREQQVNLAQVMAGTRQYNNLLTLFDNWDMYTDALETSANAAGTLQRQQDIYMQSTEAHLETLRATAEETYKAMFNQETARDFIDLVTGGLSTINKYLNGLNTGALGGVLGQLGTLGANLFSSQISSGITKNLENRRVVEQNKAQLAMDQEIYKNGFSAEDSNARNIANAELNLHKQGLDKIQNLISPEQYEKTSKQIDEVYRIRQKLVDIVDQENQYEEQINKLLEEQKTIQEEINALKDKGEDLTDEEKQNLNQLSQKAEEYKNTLAQIQGEKDAFNDNEGSQGYRAELENQANELNGNIQKTTELGNEQERINTIIKGTTALLGTWNNLQAGINIITDDDASTWEKFQGLVGVAITQGMLLLTSYQAIAGLLPALVLQTGTYTMAQIKEMAVEQGIITSKTAEITTDQIALVLKQKGIIATLAAIAVKIKEKIVTIAQTAATWAQVAAQAALNLLTGNFTTLGIAAAVAVVGMTAALVAATVAIIEANTGLNYYNKKVEETAKKVEEAREKYQELADLVSSYKDARKGIDELTEGTIEYYDAILKANEEAQKLIDNLNLVAGYDYAIGKDGLILINEDTLANKQFEEQQKVYRASAMNTQARIDRANYRKERAITGMVNASERGTGYTYKLSRNGAEQVLQGKDVSSGELELGIASKVTAGLWEKMVNEATNGHGYVDLTDAQGEYQASYRQAVAEAEQLKAVLTDQVIRGYASKKDVETYDTMNSEGKKILQDYVNAEMERNARKNYAAGKETVSGVAGFFESIPLVGNLIKGYGEFMSDLGGDNAAGRMWSSQWGGISAVKTNMEKDIRAAKAKELGYEYESGFLGTGFGSKWVNKYGQDVTDEVKGWDVDQLVEEQRTGAFAADEAAKKMAEVYRSSMEKSANAGFGTDSQKYIANAMMAVAQGRGFNARLLNEEDRKEFLKQLSETENKITDPSQGFTEKWYQGYLQDKSWQYNEAARGAADLQGYNDTLASQAKELDTTTKALELYGGAMRRAGEITGNNTTETAEAIAESYKFNKAYNNAVKTFQSSTDALKAFSKAMKENTKIDYETADAVAKVAEDLEDMGLSLSAETISSHIDLIDKLLGGTEKEAKEAYEALWELSQIDTFKTVLGEEFAKNNETAIKNLVDQINNIDIKNPAEGAEAALAKSLETMFKDVELTAQQLDELQKGLGIEIPVTFDQTQADLEITEHQFTTKGSTTKHSYYGKMVNPSYNPKEDSEDDKYIDVDYAWFESSEDRTDTINAPQWSKVKVKTNKHTAANNANFATTPSNKNTKKKSGSTAKPSKKDLNKDELDRYRLVNVQLKEISKQLDKLEKEKKKLLGGNLVANLNKQIRLLNDQMDVTERKLKIAQGEQAEVKKTLSGYGITFDKDGNISNYEKIFKQQQAKLNAVYTKYNNMSKKSQEAYQDTVKTAEETWKKFKESVSKYDNLIGEVIPGLEQDLADSFDKKTEILIEEFNAEIKVRLNMSEAERDWNEFKRKVIDGIKDDDILGMATAKLKDFSSYFNSTSTGEVQALTKQLQGQLEELRKQDENEGKGQGDWYKDNRAQAMEDLKDNLDKIEDSLTAVVELAEEMQQKLLDAMDQAQEKFEEQVDTFENINKQLEHNVELIQLLTDENNYEALTSQYAAQTRNRQEELDFYTKEKDFWENYLTTLEEGTEEWENAKAKYNEAAEAWSSALTTTIQAARKEFENNINLIFKTINNQLTNNKGLDYLNEEWTLLGENSELVLDNINKMQGLQDLSKKYTDAINSTSNIKAQQKLAELRDSELESLKAMDALSEKDLERAEKKLDIVKAQIALEDAQRNKSQMRLRRDSQGNYRYQFVADEDEIQQAQQNLSAAYNELYNFDKARYTSTLNEAAKAWSDYQQKMAEAALINDPEVRAEKEALIKSQYDEKIGILHEQLQRTMQDLNQSTFAELNALYGENEDNYALMTEEQQAALSSFENANQTAFDLIFDLYTENTDKFHNMTQDQIDVIQNQMVPQWTSGYQALVDAIEAEGGIEEVSNRLMNELQEATDHYNNTLSTTENIAGQAFSEITDTQNDIIKNNKEMLAGNQDLIDSYSTLIEEVKALYYGDEDAGIEGILTLMDKYNQAWEDAKETAKEVYDYWKDAKGIEAGDYEKNVNEGPETGNTGSYREEQNNIVQKQTKTEPNLPFDATIPKGTQLYSASGSKYNKTQANRAVTVQALVGSRYQVWGSTFNPHVVYVDKNAIKYDTGGYTGAWGKDGRLAMLHEKELVLNKKDTANMLDAVEVLRTITDNIGADVLNKMTNMRAGGLGGMFGGNSLDQNVHIEATFPGVTSSIEIQDALNNLVNMAAQRAQVK